jgi:hypothetical protein
MDVKQLNSGIIRFICAATVSVAFLATDASASVIALAGNHPAPGQENVLLVMSPNPGQLIVGRTNLTDMLVDFTTENGSLIVAGSHGQSYITGLGSGSGANGGTFHDISIRLANADRFTSLILAVNLPAVGNESVCQECIEYSVTGSAAASGRLPGKIGPGTTFFTFLAGSGEAMTSVTLSGLGSQAIEDIRQVRIGGMAELVPSSPEPVTVATPEPNTLLLLMGGGLTILGRFRRGRAR